MSDGSGDFDPCECVFSHEGAMRRLISLLQNSQGYCTNEECFQDLPGPSNLQQTGADDGSYMQFMMIWMLFAMLIYFVRPSSLFSRGDTKPSSHGRREQPPPSSGPVL